MGLQKLRFYNADTNAEVVQCHFNPDNLVIGKTNLWRPEQAAGANAPDVTFGGAGARTLRMTLIFDTYEKKSDVSRVTGKLLGLMDVAQYRGERGVELRPPHVEVGWGSFRSFRGVLTNINQTFTLFLPDGTPVRANLSVSLQEVPKVTARRRGRGQNPTSHAAGARRVRMVQPGDTIDWIAADELGEPTAWRVVAEANGLDDPRRLTPGQTLLIPPEP